MRIATFSREQQSEEHGGHTGNRDAPLILRRTESVRGTGRSEAQDEEDRRPDVLPVGLPGAQLLHDRNGDDQGGNQHEVAGKPFRIHQNRPLSIR